MAGKHGFGYVLLAMVVPDGVSHRTGEASGIMHRAFSGLVDARGYRVRWIEDVGLVGGKLLFVSSLTMEREVFFRIRVQCLVT